jgi:hypothetical protein
MELLCKNSILISLMEVLLMLLPRKSNEKFIFMGIMKIGRTQKKDQKRLCLTDKRLVYCICLKFNETAVNLSQSYWDWLKNKKHSRQSLSRIFAKFSKYEAGLTIFEILQSYKKNASIAVYLQSIQFRTIILGRGFSVTSFMGRLNCSSKDARPKTNKMPIQLPKMKPFRAAKGFHVILIR